MSIALFSFFCFQRWCSRGYRLKRIKFVRIKTIHKSYQNYVPQRLYVFSARVVKWAFDSNFYLLCPIKFLEEWLHKPSCKMNLRPNFMTIYWWFLHYKIFYRFIFFFMTILNLHKIFKEEKKILMTNTKFLYSNSFHLELKWS